MGSESFGSVLNEADGRKGESRPFYICPKHDPVLYSWPSFFFLLLFFFPLLHLTPSTKIFYFPFYPF